jgi:hypothetical protein
MVLTFITLLRHSSATILTSDSASSLHSRKSSIAMPRSFWNSGEFLSKKRRENRHSKERIETSWWNVTRYPGSWMEFWNKRDIT